MHDSVNADVGAPEFHLETRKKNYADTWSWLLMGCEGRFTWSPKSQVLLMLASPSMVSSPTHVSKSQYGGKLPTFEP